MPHREIIYIIDRNGNLEKPDRFQLAILQMRVARIASVVNEGLATTDMRVAELALAVIGRQSTEAGTA